MRLDRERDNIYLKMITNLLDCNNVSEAKETEIKNVVLYNLLYGAKYWIIYMERFSRTFLHIIMNMHCSNFITKNEISKIASDATIN